MRRAPFSSSEEYAYARRWARAWANRNSVPFSDFEDYVQEALIVTYECLQDYDPNNPSHKNVPFRAYLSQRLNWRLIDVQRKILHRTNRTYFIELHDMQLGLIHTVPAYDIDETDEVEDEEAVQRFVEWLRTAVPRKAEYLEAYLRLRDQHAVAEELGVHPGTVAVMLQHTYRLARKYGQLEVNDTLS